METHSHTEVIRASLAHCFSVIVDFERYPQWFGRIQRTEILTSDPESGLWEVRFTLDAVLKSISYTLAYSGRAPHELVWHRTDGDLADIQGRYDFVELEPGITEATCRQGVDVGFWVPGPVRRVFETSALVESVRELRTACEGGPR